MKFGPHGLFRVTAGAVLLLACLAVDGRSAVGFSQGGPDSDSDGVYDADEGPCGGDPLDSSLRPERTDGPFSNVDDDGDTQVDEPLPAASQDYDCDGDGWKGSQEILIFTSATTANDQDPCGSNGWPADVAGSQYQSKIDIGDFGNFLFPLRPSPFGLPDAHGNFNRFNHTLDDWGIGGPTGGNPPDGVIDPEMARWNLLLPPHGPTIRVDIGDLNSLNPAVLAPASRPPMFGEQPVFFTDLDGPGPLEMGECPWPP